MKIEIDDDDIPYTMISSKFLGALARKKEIKVEFSNCAGQPSEQQIAAVNLIINDKVKIYDELCQESIKYWNDLISKHFDWFDGFQKLESEKDLLEKLKIGIIWIHNNINDINGIRIGLGGSWELDDEHGYGALIQNGKIIEVGHEDVGFNDDSDYEENEYSISSDIKHLEKMIVQHKENLNNMDLNDPMMKMFISLSPVHPKVAILDMINKLEKRIIELKSKL